LKAVKETQLTDIDNQTASADMIKAAVAFESLSTVLSALFGKWNMLRADVGNKSFSAYFNQSSFGQWEEEVKNKWKEMYATTIRSAYANCRPTSGEQISLH